MSNRLSPYNLWATILPILEKNFLSSEFQVPACLLLHHYHRVVAPGMGLAWGKGKNTEALCLSFCPLGILLPLTQTRKKGLPLNFYLYLLEFQEQTIFESKLGPTEVKKKNWQLSDRLFILFSSEFFTQFLLAIMYISDNPDSCFIQSVQGFQLLFVGAVREECVHFILRRTDAPFFLKHWKLYSQPYSQV